ncbi:MAG: polysaccharide export protein, partial [Nitrospiraceae bacterium]|nr:polysaccharide export protein [Nitrospiraceae bacterium]
MPVVIIFLVAGLLQACAGGGELKHSQAVLKARQAASARRSRSAEALARMAMQNAPNPNSDYIIGPDDLLDIQVYQAKDLSGIVRVDNQNDIELPLTGKISTRGKTPAVLGNELAKRLLKYIKDPFVSVTVKEYRSRKVSVIGAVEHPRIYVMKGQKYLLDMLAEAGGLTPEAGQFCIIMRPEGSPGSQPSTKVINLDKQ